TSTTTTTCTRPARSSCGGLIVPKTLALRTLGRWSSSPPTPSDVSSSAGWRISLSVKATSVEADRPRLDAVDPQMRLAPGITRKRGADRVLGVGLDCVCHPFLVRQRAPENDEALVDEPVHERRMHVPIRLFLHRARGIPLRAGSPEHDQEHRHDRSLRAPGRVVAVAT